MKIRAIALMLLVLLAPMVLAACGGDELSTEDAEKAVRALFEGDVEEANKYVCDEEKVPDDYEIPMEGVEVKDVSCEKDGDNMSCDYTISMVVVEGEDPVETSATIPLPVKDGKICGEFNPAE